MNTLVKISVLALVTVGAAASLATPSSAMTALPTVSKLSSMPIPVCEPDGKTGCGIGGHDGKKTTSGTRGGRR